MRSVAPSLSKSPAASPRPLEPVLNALPAPNGPGRSSDYQALLLNRDYGVIMGTTLFYAFLIVMANLIVDITYAVADPRIRYD